MATVVAGAISAIRLEINVIAQGLDGAIAKRHVEDRGVSTAKRVANWTAASHARRILCRWMTDGVRLPMVADVPFFVVLRAVVDRPIVVGAVGGFVRVWVLIGLAYKIGFACSVGD